MRPDQKGSVLQRSNEPAAAQPHDDVSLACGSRMGNAREEDVVGLDADLVEVTVGTVSDPDAERALGRVGPFQFFDVADQHGSEGS